MADYDIVEAFEQIEKELMESMIANLDHHRAMETDEGFEWSQWQVEQLKALENYKKKNHKKYNTQFKDINKQIGALIYLARQQGNMDQEIKILEAIKKGFTDYHKPLKREVATDAAFFRVNDKKVDALIEATTKDFEKAEYAMLRRADDQYRKTIFNAQMYAAAGGTTYEKAVDMALKDFVKAGIQCVEYSNGAKHTMKDYADMCIRTAMKRAYLTGEGEKRKEWGISLVIMNKRGNPCPKCLPFAGKILVDDVWSGGKPDGKHMLMSKAIEKGLYHPRCRDSHTTYFEGITTAEGKPFTKEEKEEILRDYSKEQKANYCKRQAEQQSRLGDMLLDHDNRRIHKLRAAEWNSKADQYTASYNLLHEKAGAINEIHNYYASEKHVNNMRNILNDSNYDIDEKMTSPFEYRPEDDMIFYNPKHPDVNRYPSYYALVHEASHRADYMLYRSMDNEEFASALDICATRIIANKENLQQLVDDGGLYENDFAIQDIFYTLSNGQIFTKVGHQNADKLTKILETFANMSTIELLNYDSISEFRSTLKELYDVYKKMVGG